VIRVLVTRGVTLPGSRWVLGSLLFIAYKFRDLGLQEPESPKVARSGTDRLPPAPVRVGLVSKAQLRHGSSKLGKAEWDPLGDNVDHNGIAHSGTVDPIYQSSLKSGSDDDREI
jgi:hypothetical protein